MEPVFEIIGLCWASALRQAVRLEEYAIFDIWRHTEIYGPIPGDRETHAIRLEQLQEEQRQAALLVLSTGQSWHSWRLAWSRVVP